MLVHAKVICNKTTCNQLRQPEGKLRKRAKEGETLLNFVNDYLTNENAKQVVETSETPVIQTSGKQKI